MTDKDNTAADGNETIWVGYHGVVLLDVLNQREAIRRLEDLPTDQARMPQYIRSLKNSAGKVIAVRKWLLKIFDSFANAPTTVPLDSLSPDQRAMFDRMKAGKIQTQTFSDTVIAYGLLANAEGDSRVRLVYALLAATCSVMMASFAVGVPIRGAIEVGVALSLGDGDLYGPAVLETYRLESEVAQYPRVVLGTNAVAYLRAAANASESDPLTSINRELAKTCLGFIVADQDGAPMLDYLSGNVGTLLGIPEHREIVAKGLGFVNAEYKRFVDAGDHKLALRYSLLRQYYQARSAIWLGTVK